MPTTFVDFDTGAGKDSYSSKAYYNSEIFRHLFGGSPSDWGSKLAIRSGVNWDRMQKIAKDFGLSTDYVQGINLSDECINFQSASDLQQHLQNWGCTSVASGHIIGQTLDLFTVELCIVKDGDATFVTMPPYLCLLGMGKHLAMCTNHLFDKVNFAGMPISHLRRTLLDLGSIGEAVAYLKSVVHKGVTTSVNFMISDGTQAVDIEVTPQAVRVLYPKQVEGIPAVQAHTNHLLPTTFDQDTQCARLQIASKGLLEKKSVEDTLCQMGVVQPIDEAAQFGTIITVWLDPKERILAYKDPGQDTFTRLKV